MNAAITTAAAALAAQIAAMPSRYASDWQDQDLAVASILDLLIVACEGNGDAAQILTRAVEDIRCTVDMDREREALEAA